MLPDDRAISKIYSLILENHTPDYWVDDELLRRIFVYLCYVYDRDFTPDGRYSFLPKSTVKKRIHQYINVDDNIKGVYQFHNDLKKTAIVAVIVQLANLSRDDQHDLYNMLRNVFTLKGIAAGYSRRDSSSTDWIKRSKWYQEYIRFQDAAIKQIKIRNILTDTETGLDLTF